MRLLYSICIGLYFLLLRVVALFNHKARAWFYGRKELFTKLDEVFNTLNADENPSPVIWIHCASLGEYEQGRPIIQEIKKCFPGFVVLLTFFSPSGYNNRASNSEADYVFYLPIDTRRNARKFIRTVSPSLAIFVKYEFWYNYLNELYLNKIPVFTVSAIFRPEQHFFKWYGAWFRNHLRHINKIFVQDEESAELLSMIDVNNVKVSGDTRFDRVEGIMHQHRPLPAIEQFADGHNVLVAGSTWPPDEDLLKKLFDATNGTLKMIIAPHEITVQHINELTAKFGKEAILLSGAGSSDCSMFRVLIIDSIGILSQLYRYGQIAYIGGGFGVGIHNTLEAAVYGVPVLFGPNYQRFREARELITNNAAISIQNAEELIDVVQSFLSSPEKLQAFSTASSQYVEEKTGATELIMTEIENYISNVMIN